mgnify:CR=1 FL=1
MFRFRGSKRVFAQCDICDEVTGPHTITLAVENSEPVWIPKGLLREWDLEWERDYNTDNKGNELLFGVCPGCQFPKRHTKKEVE